MPQKKLCACANSVNLVLGKKYPTMNHPPQNSRQRLQNHFCNFKRTWTACPISLEFLSPNKDLAKVCSSCYYAMILFNKRNKKRKVSNPASTPSKKCNIRFLSRTGLEEKIVSQRKKLRNEIKKDTRSAQISEMLQFIEEDNSDLTRIFEGISSDNMPSNIKLLWEMQKKQLSVKSSGYCWHPQYNL